MSEKKQSPSLGLRPSAEVLGRLDAVAAAVTKSTGATTRRGGIALDALLIGLEELERRNRILPARQH
jgi:hypothetical protein